MRNDFGRLLSRVHECLHLELIESCSSYTPTYIAPLRFVIPRQILVQSKDVPEQCLSLPPSLGREQVMTDEKSQRVCGSSHAGNLPTGNALSMGRNEATALHGGIASNRHSGLSCRIRSVHEQHFTMSMSSHLSNTMTMFTD